MAYSLAPFAPQTGLRGMVTAADHLASTAGIGLLAQGGSAADAAVGAAAVMAVTMPCRPVWGANGAREYAIR